MDPSNCVLILFFALDTLGCLVCGSLKAKACESICGWLVDVGGLVGGEWNFVSYEKLTLQNSIPKSRQPG
jgi:hypothetical protein